MNLQYRNGLEKAEPTPVGEPFSATAIMKPQDHTFGQGHRIGVVLAATNVMWTRPDVPALTTHGAPRRRRHRLALRLPIVNPPADCAALFTE